MPRGLPSSCLAVAALPASGSRSPRPTRVRQSQAAASCRRHDGRAGRRAHRPSGSSPGRPPRTSRPRSCSSSQHRLGAGGRRRPRQAAADEPRNWQTWLVLCRLQAESGHAAGRRASPTGAPERSTPVPLCSNDRRARRPARTEPHRTARLELAAQPRPAGAGGRLSRCPRPAPVRGRPRLRPAPASICAVRRCSTWRRRRVDGHSARCGRSESSVVAWRLARRPFATGLIVVLRGARRGRARRRRHRGRADGTRWRLGFSDNDLFFRASGGLQSSWLNRAQALGSTVVRIPVYWDQIAPLGRSAGFLAGEPGGRPVPLRAPRRRGPRRHRPRPAHPAHGAGGAGVGRALRPARALPVAGLVVAQRLHARPVRPRPRPALLRPLSRPGPFGPAPSRRELPPGLERAQPAHLPLPAVGSDGRRAHRRRFPPASTARCSTPSTPA